jgi:dTDP-4-dehydrorhamnose reductase
MILLLGASGYVGQAFVRQFRELNLEHLEISRKTVDYYDPVALAAFIRDKKASFLINSAGYTGKPNVDACELHKADCLLGNAVLPGRIREACETAGIPWGHVSSGCIYTGRKADGAGFCEEDAPNFSFRSDHCSFYSGTKALGEEILADALGVYIWRLRIPFDHNDNPRNYLTKLLRYERLLEAENSVSHLGDFVSSCLDCWQRKLPFGTYNLTNPGAVTTSQVAELLRSHRITDKHFVYFDDESDFMLNAAKTPRSNCVLDTSKLQANQLPMRPVDIALEEALRMWIPEFRNQ